MPATTQEPHYEVFISYRRGAADELALLLQTSLQQRGVVAFLDRDLRHGVFDDTLLRRIAESPTFLIILTPNALDRCADDEDWLRKEIVHAISRKRNIIPLQVGSFQFVPNVLKNLDPAIRELSRYQAVEYSRSYFEYTIERIVKIVEENKVERKAAQETEGAKERRLVSERAEQRSEEQEMSETNQLAQRAKAQRKKKEKLEAARFTSTSISAGTIKINSKDNQKYVWIPSGTFQMGSSSGDIECNDDEEPSHSVALTRGFWLGQTPVTQAAYQRVIGANPSYFRGKQLPVESITWKQAKAYCEAVGGRLPTEAEWEYAARAGSKASRYGDINAIAWYSSNSGDTRINSTALSRNDSADYIDKLRANGNRTHPVEQKQPNAWGLYDMLGNVWEWVGDWYDENYYAESPSSDPTGPTSGRHRILRGGSWFDALEDLRSPCRGMGDPDFPCDFIGFRCAWDEIP